MEWLRKAPPLFLRVYWMPQTTLSYVSVTMNLVFHRFTAKKVANHAKMPRIQSLVPTQLVSQLTFLKKPAHFDSWKLFMYANIWSLLFWDSPALFCMQYPTEKHLNDMQACHLKVLLYLQWINLWRSPSRGNLAFKLFISGMLDQTCNSKVTVLYL